MGCWELLADCVGKISHLWLFDGHSKIIMSIEKSNTHSIYSSFLEKEKQDWSVWRSYSELLPVRKKGSSTVAVMGIQPAGFCIDPSSGGWPVPFVIQKFAWSESLPPGPGNACHFPFLFKLDSLFWWHLCHLLSGDTKPRVGADPKVHGFILQYGCRLSAVSGVPCLLHFC